MHVQARHRCPASFIANHDSTLTAGCKPLVITTERSALLSQSSPKLPLPPYKPYNCKLYTVQRYSPVETSCPTRVATTTWWAYVSRAYMPGPRQYGMHAWPTCHACLVHWCKGVAGVRRLLGLGG